MTLKCTTRQWGDCRCNHTIYFRHLHNTQKTTLKTSASRLKLNVQPRTEQASSPLAPGACSLRCTSPHRSGRPVSAAGTPRQDMMRQVKTGQGRTRQDKKGQDRTRHDWTGQDKLGQGRTRQGKARQDKTIQDRTGKYDNIQDRARQNKTEQDRTGQVRPR